MLQLDWLENHMSYSYTMAEWLHRQFSYEFTEQPLADWQHEFAEGQSNGNWKCLIAICDGELLGGAALAKEDLPERPELGPWLACVFTTPKARGQGLAERLIEAICAHAQEVGITRLYLHTHDRQDYYAKRGWQMLESFQAWGEGQWLMSRDL